MSWLDKIVTHQKNIASTNSAIRSAGVSAAKGVYNTWKKNAATHFGNTYGDGWQAKLGADLASGHRLSDSGWPKIHALESAGKLLKDAEDSGAFDSSSGTSGSKKKPSGGSGGSGGSSVVVAQPGLDYLYADLAKHYGMSKETAYQEALANTGYMRSVQDMKRAGLNPAAIYGNGRGSTASGVSYVSALGAAGGGGGGGGRRYGSGSAKGNLFSSGTYHAIAAGAGMVGMAVMKNPTGYWIGSSAAKGVMGAINQFWKGK